MAKEIKTKAGNRPVPFHKRPFSVFLLLSPVFAGGFFEWASCLYSLFLIGYLIYIGRRQGGLVIRSNLTMHAITVLVMAYGISAFWAVDHGMALLGFCKFLPYYLFAFTAAQFTPEERTGFLDAVPYLGAVMAVLSVILGLVPMLHDVFWVTGRLAGLFQYTNAFACFLLAGVVILIGETGLGGIRQFLCLLALLMGIVLSGSRTVFFLLAAVILVFVMKLKGKIRWILCLVMASVVVATVLYTVLGGHVEAVGRYLTTSLGDSTFLGRMLYYRDALPVIWKNPFGLGYKGYFYTQGSFQTGVYTLLNVHNELLQICLDVGWLPAVLSAAALIKCLVRKDTSFTKRMLIAVIAAHCLFDFDLQFICIGFLLILAMDLESGKSYVCSGKALIGGLGTALSVLCLWLGTASCLYHFGNSKAAVRVYPGYTDARVSILSNLENADEMESIADEILSWNRSVSLAYSAKARAAFARGDFHTMIACKQKAISLAKYKLEEYLDYFGMLYVGVQLYESGNDMESAAICVQRLKEIPVMLKSVLEETDERAWKIKDKPNLELPEEYQKILDAL